MSFVATAEYISESSHHSFGEGFPLEPERPVLPKVAYPASVHGGAGGRGTRISKVISSNFSSRHLQMDHRFFDVRHEKMTMQNLNERLASYLERVCNLEQANSKLEIKIRQDLEKRSITEMDYSHYEGIISDLRKKISDRISENETLWIRTDNARLALEDFRIKVRQVVEADIVRMRKGLDGSNVDCMNLESEIEALNEKRILLKKSHQKCVTECREKITQSCVHVEVDTSKGQDLAKILEEMRVKYEKIVLDIQEEITNITAEVSESTIALKEAMNQLKETRRHLHSLEVTLQAERSENANLEDTLRDTELRYKMELEMFNSVIQQLEAESTQLTANIKDKKQEYEALEAEITMYRKVLDSEEFK
ncbi:Keratin, type I cytoskeletal 18-like [Scleropages formosus]|uniref:Keratin, type I cytoskeletal 18-like n=1 Tax=Scleropages formosus TaxID=113540 RepID=A0A0P7YS53_SCLFO|nr:Keratin, type I cytoskeletal 18-like [Scleropages formosus]